MFWHNLRNRVGYTVRRIALSDFGYNVLPGALYRGLLAIANRLECDGYCYGDPDM